MNQRHTSREPLRVLAVVADDDDVGDLRSRLLECASRRSAVGAHLALDELVDIRHYNRALDVHQREGRRRVAATEVSAPSVPWKEGKVGLTR